MSDVKLVFVRNLCRNGVVTFNELRRTNEPDDAAPKTIHYFRRGYRNSRSSATARGGLRNTGSTNDRPVHDLALPGLGPRDQDDLNRQIRTYVGSADDCR